MACNTKKHNATISFHVANSKGQNVLLATIDVVANEFDTLALVRLDSLGNASINLELTKSIFSTAAIGQNYYSLFLEPNADVRVQIDSSVIKYSGKGADANNYLYQSSKIRAQFESSGGKTIFDLKPDALFSRLDSLQKAFSQLHITFADSSKTLSKETLWLLERSNKLFNYLQKQNYIIGVLSDVKSQNEIPKRLRNIEDEMPFDEKYLSSNMPIYSQTLIFYLVEQQNQVFKILKLKNPNVTQQVLSSELDKKLRGKNIKPNFKELVLAKNTCNLLINDGISTTTDTLFSNFKSNYPNSNYFASIQKRHDKWLSLAKGKQAPTIEGTMSNGKPFSITDLKGKVVYVDVWATWCEPCRKEFPDAKRLQKQFENNDKVVFLYVSLDSDKAAWHKFLQADKAFKGLHINLSEAQSNQMWQSYLMSGVPRYILIDKEGKLINANADRPSSGKMAAEIGAILE